MAKILYQVVRYVKCNIARSRSIILIMRITLGPIVDLSRASNSLRVQPAAGIGSGWRSAVAGTRKSGSQGAGISAINDE
jgi:hypothetical protein